MSSPAHVRPMSRRARTAALALLAVGAMVALSGCFKLDMQLELASDDTVDGSIVVAVQRSFADLAGGEDALRESLTKDGNGLVDEQPTSGSVEMKDYSDADWIGVEYVMTDVPLEEFGGNAEGDDLSITREGDEFHVAGTLDMSQGTDSDPSVNAMLDGAEINISITFPGDVVSSNGQEDGNTVTWTPKAGDVLELQAVGKAEGGLPWALIFGAVAVLLLLVVGLALLLVVRKRQPEPAVPGPLEAGSIVPGADGTPPAPVADAPPAPEAPSAPEEPPAPPQA